MAEGSEIEIDPEAGIIVINDSGVVSTEEAAQALMNAGRSIDSSPEYAALHRWASNTRRSRNGNNIFHRDKYVNPENMFDKFRVAARAMREDDIVSNVADTTEQIAFKRILMECENEAEQDIWNQIINELNLSERFRECWREFFCISQFYPAVVYGNKTFRVGKTKKYFRNLEVPIGITLLDPLKVIPVGNFMFNQEKLVYIASESEMESFDTLAEKNTSDLVVSQLLKGKYNPPEAEKKLLKELLPDVTNMEDNLYELNPKNVWRVTATRPSYRRFADVRMESVFELLDMKNLLREMDRSVMMGTTNAIILVKKGDSDRPAKQGEIDATRDLFKTSARIPLVVSDHRIEIEYIVPKADKTLSPERYNGLDSRITSRMYQILSTGNYSSGTSSDDSMKLLRVVAASMEARRDQIRDSFMDNCFLQVWERNKQLQDKPKMQFYPNRIALDFDATIAQFLQDLRDRGDISRATMLAQLDIMEDEEAVKRKREAEQYDDIFTPVNVPFDGPGGVSATPKAQGRSGGGNKNGGGRNPNSNTPNAASNTEDS